MSENIESNRGDNNKILGPVSPNLNCTDLATRFELHGWQPDPSISDDENYMDLVLLVTRNSICLQGYMGCVIVNPNLSSTPDESCNSMPPILSSVASPQKCQQVQQQQVQQQEQDLEEESSSQTHSKPFEERIHRDIIGASTNLPLFTQFDSDIHAEIGALGQCNQYGNVTKGSIAYITMSPCKRCFAALLSAGVTKIVTQQRHPEVILRTAGERGITMVDMGIEYKASAFARIEHLIQRRNGKTDISEEERKELLFERRKRRKEQRQAKKKAKVERRTHLETMHKDTNS
mmetsp:Transcript_1614/g.1757  ORF Transcript_1614/g.1757 Transcript_1614/m.1757 type:complete len:290 (-) Transcript_1614:13-882(-)